MALARKLQAPQMSKMVRRRTGASAHSRCKIVQSASLEFGETYKYTSSRRPADTHSTVPRLSLVDDENGALIHRGPQLCKTPILDQKTSVDVSNQPKPVNPEGVPNAHFKPERRYGFSVPLLIKSQQHSPHPSSYAKETERLASATSSY